MMKRLLSLLLASALIAVLAVPVSASHASGWTELLETCSVQPDGSNTFIINGMTGSVSFPIYGEKRLRRIDMLIWNPTGVRPISATVSAGDSTTNLELISIGSQATRIVGYVPNAWYESLTIDFKKGGSTPAQYEVLSCKVTSLGMQEYVCNASVYLESYGTTGTYSTSYNIPLYREDSGGEYSDGAPYLARIDVKDWYKYDSISIWGSATSASIESIRASINTTALDISVNYIDVESYETSVDGDPTYWETAQFGKYLFNVTIDLSNVDRTATTSLLLLYITGSYDLTTQAYFNCQYVNGALVTADTTNVTWWNRFTAFMSGLFGSESNSDALDDLGGSSDSITQDAADIHAFEQSQQAVLDSNFSAIQTAVTFTNFAAALTFVQRYSNMAFAGISDYSIVLTLPLFLGLFFYICSRIPGVTRWKSRPPKAKGGDDP